MIERVFQAVLLLDLAVCLHVGSWFRGRREHRREIDSLCLPVLNRVVGFEQIDSADEFVHRANAERRHDLAAFLGGHEEVIDDVFRLAVELLAEFRVLRRDADRAGVEVTLPHHDAAEHDERRGREAELFGSQHAGDGDIAAGLQLSVGL